MLYLLQMISEDELHFIAKLCRVRLSQEDILDIREDCVEILKFLSFDDFSNASFEKSQWGRVEPLEDKCHLLEDTAIESGEDFHKRLRETSPFTSHGYIKCVEVFGEAT